MLLKSIEIKGFKSFGDRVIINFNHGITGIVGPNGCGKSNVVDAIRWVLGEQKTKALRSEKMENVIFNGTNTRKPANLAEVTLSFENTKNLLPTEYSNVSITRKLYRSGESEYQINGVHCRLKDITNLFLDTGIGSDTYAIMELRMIEEILNDKDNARREMFEEASGVSKYKIRKKETLAKLKETQLDLDRVLDLLFEIDKNLRNLQAQAKKTERYYALRENYKIVALNNAALIMSDFERSLITLVEVRKQFSEERLAFDSAINLQENALEKLKLELLHLEKLLASRQKATNDFIAEIRAFESERKLKNERLRMLSDKQTGLTKQLGYDKNHYDTLKTQIAELTQQLAKETTAFEEVSNQLQIDLDISEKSKAKSIASKESVQFQQANFKKLEDELYKLEKSLAVNKIQVDSLQKELNRNTNDANLKGEELDTFNIALEETAEKKSALSDELEQLTAQELALTKQIEETEIKQKAQTQALQILNRTLDSKQNEYNLTKSLVDNLEGYPESLKFLKKNTAWSKQAQLLSDIITCVPDYKVAIEGYLEPYLNYYVVANYQDAMAGIKLLSDAGRGRANFFMNDAFAPSPSERAREEVKAPSSSERAEGEVNCTPALEVVSFDEQYRALISFLLKDVYFLPKGSSGAEFLVEAQSYGNTASQVFLDVDGRFAGNRLSLSGGSVGLFEGKRIGRKRNLEILQKDIQQLETDISQNKKELVRLDALVASLKAKRNLEGLKSLEKEVNAAQNEYNVLAAKREQHEVFIKTNKNRRTQITEQLEVYQSALDADSPRLEILAKEKAAAEAELKQLNAEIEQIVYDAQVASATYNQTNLKFHQQQNKIATLQRDNEYKTQQYLLLEKRIEEHTIDLKVTEKEISGILSEDDQSDGKLPEMYQQKEDMEAAIREAEDAFYKQRGEINAVEEAIKDIRQKKENIDLLLAENTEKQNATNLKKSSLLERLSVEFNLQRDQLEELSYEGELSQSDLQREQDEIKNKLDNFGAINPMAIEAYEEIKQRNEFIQVQKEDLVNAKQGLLDTISEIDETANTRFKAAFDTIRENFMQVFRSLFTEEDTCDLVLTNPSQPLESDINIIAKPKGKRPLTINQLSGGEKTLTATALLFAIYLFKPAPFCVFDEVDAPLDDNNIEKFNKIIRKFSDASQFIIVTHNKKTMETTDIIYGVTMVEQGVSRVVPVDLTMLN